MVLTLSNLKKSMIGFITDDLKRAISDSTNLPVTLHGKWDCLYNFSGGMKLRSELLQIYAVIDVLPQNFLIGDRWNAFSNSNKNKNEYSEVITGILTTVPRNLYLEYQKLDVDHMRHWLGYSESPRQERKASFHGASSELKYWRREYMLHGVLNLTYLYSTFMWQTWHHTDVEDIRQADKTLGVVYYFFFSRREMIFKLLSFGLMDHKNKSDDDLAIEKTCFEEFESFMRSKDWEKFYYAHYLSLSETEKGQQGSEILTERLNQDSWWERAAEDQPQMAKNENLEKWARDLLDQYGHKIRPS
jgi:hypothetical protein